MEEAPRVVTAVRDAFASVINGLPTDVARAVDLSKALAINAKLGWQIMKLVYETDPFVAAQYMPGERSIEKFLDAAAARQVSPAVIDAAKDAMREFQRLVRVHAGDREGLDMLATGCAGREVRSSCLDYRKAAFTGNSFTFGVYARVQLASSFVFPAEDESRFNLLSVRGFVELRRLRPNVSWPIQTAYLMSEDGSNQPTMNRTPLDPTDQDEPAAGVPILRKFSTHPESEVRRVFQPNRVIRDELVAGGVGKRAVVNCLLGEVLWNMPGRYRTDSNHDWGVASRIRTPCEVLILDQFVHRDVFGPVSPRAEVFSDLTESAGFHLGQRADDRLDLFERVEFLGQGLSGIRTPELPQYVDLADHVLGRVGLKSDVFDVYRIRIEYPPLPTTVAMMLDLPAAPEMR